MIKIGDFNKLEVKRSTDFGYFLDGKTNNSKDDILLHKRLIGKNAAKYAKGESPTPVPVKSPPFPERNLTAAKYISVKNFAFFS